MVGFLFFLDFFKPFNKLLASIAPKLIYVGATKIFLRRLCRMSALSLVVSGAVYIVMSRR